MHHKQNLDKEMLKELNKLQQKYNFLLNEL